MARKYMRKLGARPYKNYSDEHVINAVRAVKRGMLLRKAEEMYKVPMRSIKNKVDQVHMQKPGKPQILTEKEEKDLIEYAKLCADWGQPMSKMELRLTARSVLLLEGRKSAYVEEKDDLPGENWVSSFIERHKEEIKLKTGGNIKPTRAAVSEDIVTTYFDNLKGTAEGVSSKAIINYDETNLGDNPGQKRFVYKRTTKYPECIINYSKGNTSIMMAGIASGVSFPPPPPPPRTSYIRHKICGLHGWKMAWKRHDTTHQKVVGQSRPVLVISFLPQLFLTARS